MKAYTDIEQGRKLAEILPVESADMYYTVCADEEDNAHDGYDDVRLRIENPFGDDELKKWYSCYKEIDWYDSPYVPCWSLAALLNVLPISIDEGQHCLALINSNPNGDIEWLCGYEDYKGNLMTACYGDNQIDACMEMILKLKEYNLL